MPWQGPQMSPFPKGLFTLMLVKPSMDMLKITKGLCRRKWQLSPSNYHGHGPQPLRMPVAEDDLDTVPASGHAHDAECDSMLPLACLPRAGITLHSPIGAGWGALQGGRIE